MASVLHLGENRASHDAGIICWRCAFIVPGAPTIWRNPLAFTSDSTATKDLSWRNPESGQALRPDAVSAEKDCATIASILMKCCFQASDRAARKKNGVAMVPRLNHHKEDGGDFQVNTLKGEVTFKHFYYIKALALSNKLR